MNTNPIQDRSALRWIGDDLNELLRGARRDLEAYAEGDGDITHMRSCRDQLHQIQGTLQMVQVYGGAMLVDEMEKVAGAIIDASIAEPTKAAEPLMLGMVQLPNYIERLEAGDPDIPLNLLPVLNDLRTVRQQPMVSEMSMYAPKLEGIIAAEPVDPNRGNGNRALRRELRHWRNQFQRAILGWYKEPQVTSHLNPIKEQLDAVFELARTTRLQRLLGATDALVVDIMESEALPDKDEKLLFGRLDRFFKLIIDCGEEAAVHDFPVDLLRQILYYVSRSESDNPVVRKVRDLAFEANSFFDADAAGSEATAVGANRELYAAVGDALRQDLRALQDDLDLYMRGDRDDLQRLEALSTPLGRVGDTLGVIGSGNLRARLKALAEQISDIVKSGIPPEDEPLMAIAQDILQIDSALGDLDKPRGGSVDAAAQNDVGLSNLEMREHTASALQEAFAEMRKVKDAFSGFLQSPEDARSLGEVPAQLRQVSGVLHVLGEPNAGALLASLAPYCEDLANGSRGLPDDREKDAVADIITGVEFYLEAVQEDRGGRQEILAYARKAGETLGLAVPAEPALAAAPHIELVASAPPIERNVDLTDNDPTAEQLTLVEGELPVSDAASVTEVAGSAATSEASLAPRPGAEPTLTVIDGGKAETPLEMVDEVEWGGVGAQPLGFDAATSEEVDVEVSAETSGARNLVEDSLTVSAQGEGIEFALDTIDESAADEQRDGAVLAGEVGEVADLPFADAETSADDTPATPEFGAPVLLADIDEEILEVFLEEAREELAVIQEQYPRWRSDTQDTQALQTFRRSFHTLKGSGRLVGASAIGEFAWSIENLLNRVLENTVAVDERLTGILDDACAVLPSLVDAQAGAGVADVVAVERIASQADALADSSLSAAEPGSETVEQLVDESAAVAAPEGPDTETTDMPAKDLGEAIVDWADAGELVVESVEADAHIDDAALAPTDEVEAAAFTATERAPKDTVEPTQATSEQTPQLLEPVELELAEMDEFETSADFGMAPESPPADIAVAEPEASTDLLAQESEALELELAEMDEFESAADFGIAPEPPPADIAVAELEVSADLPAQESEALELELAEMDEPESAADFGMAPEPPPADIAVAELEASADLLAQKSEALELELAEMDEPESAADFGIVPEPEPPPADKAVQELEMSTDLPAPATEALELELADFTERPPDRPTPVDATRDEPGPEAGFAGDLAEASLEPLEPGAQPQANANKAAVFMDEIVLEMPGFDESAPGVSSAQTLTESTTEQPAASPESAAKEDADAPRPFLGSDQESMEEDVVDAADVELSGVSIELDSTLHEVFRAEAQAHFDKLEEFFDRARAAAEPLAFEQDLERAWHTLHGSARMAGVDPVAELAKALERYVNVGRQLRRKADPESVALLARGEAVCQSIIETINTEGAELPAWRPLCEEVARSTAALEGGVTEAPRAAEASAVGAEFVLDPELLEIFLEEARELNERLETEFQAWIEAPEDRAPLADLQRTLHTLKGGARLAGIAPLGDLSHALESLFEAVVGGDLGASEQLQNVTRRGVDFLASAVESLHEGGRLGDTAALITRVEAAARGEFPESEMLLSDSVDLTEGAADAGLDPDSNLLDAGANGDSDGAELDPELLEIFLEEARELSERMETELQAWTAAPQERAPVADLQRTLHTFKGGARLAGLMTLGDLSHALESLFETVVDGDLETSAQLLAVVRQGVDFLAGAIEALPSADRVPDTSGIVARIEAALRGEFSDSIDLVTDFSEQGASELVPGIEEGLEMASDDAEDSKLVLDSELLGDSRFADSILTEAAEQGQVIPFSPRSEDRRAPRRPRLPAEAKRGEQRRAERVRVSADALDQLVNSAGEVSIYRARLDQQNNTLGFNLQELDQTVTRLREQLRKLEIETEIQILSHHESEKDPDFDPLELDRYSAIQELSRALSETVSDLSSIGGTLADLNRDTETLLLQHARVSNELQDGLLRTRMVPFGSRISRFQRIVRQTGDSLGKRVELDVGEARGEMDRSILERVMAPLEHLLRNAVAHGIEEPEARAASGKNEIGQIRLNVQREGTEIVITVEDDGAGLDREAIRAKAIDRGLLDPSKSVKDSDLDAYILAPGFTTSKQVTQIAGRGVGMDVVQSEVKQLGGTLNVESEPGKGARFTIRLPYTLAITEGLLLQQGEDVYAAPYGTIDGVIRISRDDLEACYKRKRDAIDYAGISYRVRYLGNMLGTGQPDLVEGQKWFPVLLARSGEHCVAVHVDAVLGNRQIVVKSVGPQLVQVPAFTGATILADGQVALILDINSLVRMDAALQAAPVVLPTENAATKSVTVMVVDDSITVRKVTSRLLERHNMGVITAKDGVDAVTKLQDVRPDVMLLDIEMPRMDGFELARHIQNSADLQGLPIVMITSRTGEKHRKRAMELGVRHYLGKPYQESDLLEHIYDVLAEQVSE